MYVLIYWYRDPHISFLTYTKSLYFVHSRQGQHSCKPEAGFKCGLTLFKALGWLLSASPVTQVVLMESDM